MEKYTFRQSELSLFLKSPALFLERWRNKDSFKPNDAMLYGTAQHKLKEKESGEYGEINIVIDFGFCFLSGTLDYFDKKLIKDFKFTIHIDNYKPYINQIKIYQWLVWKKYNLLVPARLEMNEVLQGFDEFSLTGKIKNWEFVKPTEENLNNFSLVISDSLKKMIYLIENAPKKRLSKKEFHKKYKEEIEEAQKEIKAGRAIGVNRSKKSK